MSRPKPANTRLNREPAYQQIFAILESEIRQSPPGSRLATEAELAERFGVSLITIRQAMAKLEKDALIERRRGSGTYVKEKPLSARHVGILLDVDISTPGLSPYYIKLTQEIRRKLAAFGVENRPYFGFQVLGEEQCPLTCEDLMKDIELNRIEGIIALFMGKERSWMRVAKAQNIPILDFTYLDEDGRWPMKTHFVHTAFGYLRERGRKRIAILAHESEYDDRRPLSRIVEKFAPEYGIQIVTQLTDWRARAWESGMGWERFREIWLAQPVKPDALVIADENLFADCQRAIQELRIAVPEDMDVIVRSSDAVELTPAFPVLVWSYQVSELAFLYARRMKEILQGEPAQAVKGWPVSARIEGPGYRSLFSIEDTARVPVREMARLLEPMGV